MTASINLLVELVCLINVKNDCVWKKQDWFPLTESSVIEPAHPPNHTS